MNRYKKYIPIVALVLVALGVNLDKFGIDLAALSRGEAISLTSNSSDSRSKKLQNNSGNRSGAATESGNHPAYKQWSDTKPGINLWHIFEGETNRKGKPVGFHSRPSGIDPANARVLAVRDGPNNDGVYTATIAIRQGNDWQEKFSSFFPDSLSRDEVIQAVLFAYKNSKAPKAQPWEGPSGQGFRIQGYTSSRGGINTAFPIFTR